MFKPFIPARSKLKNFAPKILLCAQLGVLSVRNANIVFGGTAEEFGIRSSCLGKRQSRAVNYSVVNYNRQGKHRRLWRLAVATQPSIADYYIRNLSARRINNESILYIALDGETTNLNEFTNFCGVLLLIQQFVNSIKFVVPASERNNYICCFFNSSHR